MFGITLTEAADLSVAGATLLLAAATALMAHRTRRAVEAAQREADATMQAVGVAREQASAGQRQADVANETLRSSTRPLLGDAPRHQPRDTKTQLRFENGQSVELDNDGTIVGAVSGGFALFSLPIRNIGAGVALIRDAQLHTATPSQATIPGSTDQLAIPSTAQSRVNFSVPAEPDPDRSQLLSQIETGNVVVSLTYTGLTPDEVLRSRYVLQKLKGDWTVKKLEFLEGDAATGPLEPFGTASLE